MRLSRWVLWSTTLFGLCSYACGDTVDPGPDFQIAEVVYDEGFYYCAVEPMLFSRKCGPGDSGEGDAAGGCHFNVTSFRLSDYSPRVGDSCQNGRPTISAPAEANANYQSAQTKMALDLDRAQLLTRPTGGTSHPRRVFNTRSPEAEVIRDWATRFASQ